MFTFKTPKFDIREYNSWISDNITDNLLVSGLYRTQPSWLLTGLHLNVRWHGRGICLVSSANRILLLLEKWLDPCLPLGKYTPARNWKKYLQLINLKLNPNISTFLYLKKPTRCTNFTNLFWHETLHVSDSSSAHHQEFIHCTLNSGICHIGL